MRRSCSRPAGSRARRRSSREHVAPAAPLRLRANPWSAGDGLLAGLERGAATSAGMAEFYGRNMPDADFGEAEFVPQAQLYGRFARVFDEDGVEFFRGRGLVVGERPRAGDGAPARRAGLLRPRRRGARRACARADGRRPGRGRAHAARSVRPAVPAAAGRPRRGASQARDHAHDRRPAGRHEGARARRRRPSARRASSPRAPTRAGSPRAATRAGLRARSSWA